MKNIILWILLALIWSSSFAAIKIGVESISPMALVAGRMAIATILLLIILKIKSLSLPKDIKTWVMFFIIGMAGNVIPFYLINYGEINVGSGLAALLMSITPIATVFLAPLILLDEKYNIRSIFGIIFGVIGLIILVGIDVILGIGENILSQIAIIVAALFYAFTTIFVKRFVTDKPIIMASGSMLVGTITIIIISLAVDQPATYIMPSNVSLAAMIYLGVFPTALATLIYFYLLPKIGASRMSQINFLIPVLGAFIGVFFMQEVLQIGALYALIIILLAIYLVTSGQKVKKTKAKG